MFEIKHLVTSLKKFSHVVEKLILKKMKFDLYFGYIFPQDDLHFAHLLSIKVLI